MALFLAWMPQGETLARLGALRDAQRDADRVRRWTSWRRDAQLHMTLRYLGDTLPAAPTGLRDALTAIASAHAPPEVVLDRIDAWPHVLVARGDAAPDCRNLLQALDAAARGAGYPAHRPQMPHMTLAYATRHGTKALGPATDPDPVALPAPLTVRIESLRVVRTVPDGYATVASFPLHE